MNEQSCGTSTTLQKIRRSSASAVTHARRAAASTQNDQPDAVSGARLVSSPRPGRSGATTVTRAPAEQPSPSRRPSRRSRRRGSAAPSGRGRRRSSASCSSTPDEWIRAPARSSRTASSSPVGAERQRGRRPGRPTDLQLLERLALERRERLAHLAAATASARAAAAAGGSAFSAACSPSRAVDRPRILPLASPSSRSSARAQRVASSSSPPRIDLGYEVARAGRGARRARWTSASDAPAPRRARPPAGVPPSGADRSPRSRRHALPRRGSRASSCSKPPVSIGQWMPHSFGASGLPPPAAGARVLARARRAGAGRAADRRVPLGVERVAGHVVLADVVPDLLDRPLGERVQLDEPAVVVVDLDLADVRAGRPLLAAQPGDPGVEARRGAA